MNEHGLGNMFAPHKVCSARILRDRNGNGRGVGFARYVVDILASRRNIDADVSL